MAEIKTLIYQRPMKFSGLLNLKELYTIIDKWLRAHHYDKVEVKNFEDVYEDGKQIVLELLPYKKITDYAKIEIRIYAEFTNLTEEVVERSGLRHKLMKGDAFFSFDCYIHTDYEGHWETKAIYYFFRTLVDKFVYKSYMSKFEREAVSDTGELIDEIKGYLNMERFK